MIFLLKVDIKIPHKSENFSFNINRVIDFFYFAHILELPWKFIFLSMCRMSFQSIITHIGADILEISLEILTGNKLVIAIKLC